MPKYYAVARGRKTGVFPDWTACKSQVVGHSGAKYKSFASLSEAQAFVNGSQGLAKAPSSRFLKPSTKSSGLPASASGAAADLSTEQIYTDGALRGNGKVLVPKSGYGVYYGPDDPRNAAVPLTAVDDVTKVKPTNQRAELHAFNHALKGIEQDAEAKQKKGYTIYTDSMYTKNAVSKWAYKWKDTNWRSSTGGSVKNQDIIEEAHDRYNKLVKQGVPINIVHVRGHQGNAGNEEADRLANLGADKM